jgi:hypothetical protein
MLCLTACVSIPEPYTDTAEGNFEALWHTIDTRYCFLDYKKVNWDSVYVAYRPRLENVHTEYELFDLLDNMLDELKDGHVNLYSDFNRSRYWHWFLDHPKNFDGSLIYEKHYLGDDYRISGGFKYQKIDSGRVGYAYYGSFSEVFKEENLQQMFDYFSHCNGLILDVRSNGGGNLSEALRLASCFISQRNLVAYIAHKTGDGHTDFSTPTPIYVAPNDSACWRKPLIILTNRMSYSATNCFVTFMKKSPQTLVVGDQTGGGGGMPMASELPNGWTLRFSACPMFDASMNQVEWGINPDVKVDMSDADQYSGYDTIIERAIALLRSGW